LNDSLLFFLLSTSHYFDDFPEEACKLDDISLHNPSEAHWTWLFFSPNPPSCSYTFQGLPFWTVILDGWVISNTNSRLSITSSTLKLIEALYRDSLFCHEPKEPIILHFYLSDFFFTDNFRDNFIDDSKDAIEYNLNSFAVSKLFDAYMVARMSEICKQAFPFWYQK